MIFRSLTIFLFFLIHSNLFSQLGTGQWRMHTAARLANGIAQGNGKIVCSLEQGLLEFDNASGESRVLNKVNQLSDIPCTSVFYHQESASFFIGYANGNIDVLSSESTITNIPAIKLSSVQNGKNIVRFLAKDKIVYALCPFGIVVINSEKNEVKDSYYPNGSAGNLTDFVFANDSIYVSTGNLIKKAKISNPILADQSQWIIDARFPALSQGIYSHISYFENQHYVALKLETAQDSLYRLTSSGLELSYGNTFPFDIQELDVDNNRLVICDAYYAVLKESGTEFSIASYGSIQAYPKGLILYDGFYWIADSQAGLVKYNPSSGVTFINQSGLPQKDIFSIESFEGKQIVTAGIIDRVNFNYIQNGVYTFENEKWTQISKSQGNLLSTEDLFDMGCASINPKDPKEVFVGGYNRIPLVKLNENQGVAYFTNANSLIAPTSLGNSFSCINDLEHDVDNNLWMINSYSVQPLTVRKADGTWKKFETGSSVKNTFTSELAIDYNGNKWFSSYQVGLVGYNDNGTIDNEADDIFKVYRVGQGQGNLPSANVTAIAVDFDNEIWVGTDNGFVILYNSDASFNVAGVEDLSEILINFEGNVEAFLSNTSITDIEVDGGNRKWIATENAGIILVSADGQEIISSFTVENSDLISNNIVDIDFNHTTGELFVITDLGLVSFRADASYEDSDYSDVKVFPNPVRPEFKGPITIQGIRYNSDVKITDAAGNLVYKTTSNGGTATWDGKNLNGSEVATGVYFIWSATNEKFSGKNKKVGKVAIVR